MFFNFGIFFLSSCYYIPWLKLDFRSAILWFYNQFIHKIILLLISLTCSPASTIKMFLLLYLVASRLIILFWFLMLMPMPNGSGNLQKWSDRLRPHFLWKEVQSCWVKEIKALGEDDHESLNRIPLQSEEMFTKWLESGIHGNGIKGNRRNHFE